MGFVYWRKGLVLQEPVILFLNGTAKTSHVLSDKFSATKIEL